jgi:hypothetical protein
VPGTVARQTKAARNISAMPCVAIAAAGICPVLGIRHDPQYPLVQ